MPNLKSFSCPVEMRRTNPTRFLNGFPLVRGCFSVDFEQRKNGNSLKSHHTLALDHFFAVTSHTTFRVFIGDIRTFFGVLRIAAQRGDSVILSKWSVGWAAQNHFSVNGKQNARFARVKKALPVYPQKRSKSLRRKTSSELTGPSIELRDRSLERRAVGHGRRYLPASKIIVIHSKYYDFAGKALVFF